MQQTKFDLNHFANFSKNRLLFIENDDSLSCDQYIQALLNQCAQKRIGFICLHAHEAMSNDNLIDQNDGYQLSSKMINDVDVLKAAVIAVESSQGLFINVGSEKFDTNVVLGFLVKFVDFCINNYLAVGLEDGLEDPENDGALGSPLENMNKLPDHFFIIVPSGSIFSQQPLKSAVPTLLSAIRAMGFNLVVINDKRCDSIHPVYNEFKECASKLV